MQENSLHAAETDASDDDMSRYGQTGAALCDGPGPFYAADIPVGSRYELYDGHPIYCAPAGADGSRRTASAAKVLDSDPVVEECGIDTGYSTGPKDLKAPDVAVGNVPDKPGWVAGVPALALEYASVGQDEKSLQQKIVDLLARGTKWIWVVRLIGPRRVEVYAPNEPMRLLGPGDELVAPGVLKNPVPVNALYDRDVAHDVTLRNLLQRKGYENLDAVLSEGREEGREEGRADALLAVLQARNIDVTDDVRARIRACHDVRQFDRWLRNAAVAQTISDVFQEQP